MTEREEPDPLLRLAGEWLLQDGLRRFDKTHDVRDSLRRLLERIVRECAEVAWQSDASGLREDGRYILRRWGLAESEESK